MHPPRVVASSDWLAPVRRQMYLSRLSLVNFRSYARLALDLGPGLTLFVGENGQGKTNLLEAVYYLATTRSPRAGTDRELVRWEAQRDTLPFARLEARVRRATGDLHLEVLIKAEGPSGNGGPPILARSIRVNGLPSKAAQLIGQVTVVLFSPEDVALAAGPPQGRRRYLDITCSQVDSRYLRALQRFNRVLLQRNHLLRQVRERRQGRALLDPWTDELVASGVLVVRRRLDMLRAVNRVLGSLYRALARTGQQLEASYESTVTESPDGLSEADLATGYRRRLADLLPREIEQGVSLVGPHRDDFTLRLEGIDLGTYGSRGQQRLAVLALKLAEAEFIGAETGERPILLLDDVFSELDSQRRRYVQEWIAGAGQALMTATDLEVFAPSLLELAQVFRVEQGLVRHA